MDIVVKDANGAHLSDRDSVQVIKDLKVKGTSKTLKRGTAIKNIRLTQNKDEIECNAEGIVNDHRKLIHFLSKDDQSKLIHPILFMVFMP